MRKFLGFALSAVFLSLPTFSIASASATLSVRVTDPRSAPVSNARVTVFPADSNKPVALLLTAGDGSADFHALPSESLRIEVLAAGFAPQILTADLRTATGSHVNVTMKLAARQETVIVTASDTPLTIEDSGAQASILDRGNLELQQPLSINDAIRFLPGAVINSPGRRGNIVSSLFVRGGESTYNKVIIDGVPVNDPGGTHDFGGIPLTGIDRLEFVRGADSTLYGTDAVTSVVQLFSATGHTRTPELRFGAEGGTFSTARGYASFAGALKRLDYNLFGEQSNTDGQGVNDTYSNASQGGNIGVALTDRLELRLRARHSNARTGVQGAWNYNGQPRLTPDSDQFTRLNNFLGSAELTFNASSQWRHTVSGFEYNHRRLNADPVAAPSCFVPPFVDCDFNDSFHANRAGFEYRGEFSPLSWTHTTFGYQFEDENAFSNQNFSGFIINSHGLRRNNALYVNQVLNWKRLSLISGVRYVHDEGFGNRGVPRFSATYLAWRGNTLFTGTRLRFTYGEGYKEPRLEDIFGSGNAFGPVALPNPNLKPELSRLFETGFIQNLGQRTSFAATYYNNRFSQQVVSNFDFVTFTSQAINLNSSFAHGAEFELHSRPLSRVSLDAAYNYTSTQVLDAPTATDPLRLAGRPFLRRPKHSGSLLVNFIGTRWGGNLGGSFVGRRVDSDFLGLRPVIDHAAGYARLDASAWYAINHYVTGYINIENFLNKHYEEVTGYPALKANFRAGLRFRVGGEK